MRTKRWLDWRMVASTLMISATSLASQPVEAALDPIETALERAERAVAEIVAIPDRQRTFANTIGALDDFYANIELDTNMTMFMAYVSTDVEERARGSAAEERVTNWLIELGKNEDLYNAVRAYADTNPSLSGDQARMLEQTLRDYRRAGMALSAEDRAKLTDLQKEINRLGIQFDEAIRNDETTVPLTREELSGVPASYFEQGLTESNGVYLINMSYPQFLPIQDHCDNELTRQKVWVAYKRRGGRQNVQVLEQMLKLRNEAARLLGYAHAADYETEVRMAKNAANVASFYERLRPLVRKKAKLDNAEFTAAKRTHTGNPNAVLQPWDTSFYKNYLMREKYSVDTEAARAYFPLSNVMDGLFSITQSLYGLAYEDVTAEAESRGRPLWHPDVQLFEVTDNRSGQVIGEFYLDLHPRDNKYGHAAQWGLAQHKRWSNGSMTRPLAALVCNFTKPTATRPSLMTHDEVETFFHEFGHCLHTLLSTSTYWQFSGTSVERDFVEAPSQMFENWVWNADVLNTFAAHYETGARLPRQMLDGMIAAKNLGSGMAAERQFYYGLVDMTYHTDADGVIDTTEVGIDLFADVETYERIPGTYFQASFGHLNGYQAGYYGYQWSLVYASDMFQRFKELGMLDPDAGMYYRDKILSRGGTKDGLDLVRDYLGREPDLSAYLRHLGLETD